MAKLTLKKRNSLSEKDFALPGRRYPIEDKNHAKAALSRISAHGTSEEKAKVRKKVESKFPGIKVGGKNAKGKKHTSKKRVERKG